MVLCGGKSLRLGRDKTLESFGRETLLERVLFRLISLQNDVILVGNNKQDLKKFTARFPNLGVAVDIYPEKGPAGGIYTGLLASANFYNIVIACDMPFVSSDLLCYMVQQCNGYDVVVPEDNGYYEPLHAVYSRNCIEPLKKMLDSGESQLSKLYSMVRTKYINNSEVECFDKRHLSFFNINTEADLARARMIEMTKSGFSNIEVV